MYTFTYESLFIIDRLSMPRQSNTSLEKEKDVLPSTLKFLICIFARKIFTPAIPTHRPSMNYIFYSHPEIFADFKAIFFRLPKFDAADLILIADLMLHHYEL